MILTPSGGGSPGKKKTRTALYMQKGPSLSNRTLNFVYTAAAALTGTVAEFEPPTIFGYPDGPQEVRLYNHCKRGGPDAVIEYSESYAVSRAQQKRSRELDYRRMPRDVQRLYDAAIENAD